MKYLLVIRQKVLVQFIKILLEKYQIQIKIIHSKTACEGNNTYYDETACPENSEL